MICFICKVNPAVTTDQRCEGCAAVDRPPLMVKFDDPGPQPSGMVIDKTQFRALLAAILWPSMQDRADPFTLAVEYAEAIVRRSEKIDG